MMPPLFGPISLTAIVAIVSLVIFSGLWIGLTGLPRSHRHSAWWLMALGTLLLSLAPIGYFVGMGMLIDSVSSHGGSPIRGGNLMAISGLGLLTGMVLFCTGFAIHGRLFARVVSRLIELEHIASEMAREPEVLRSRQPDA